MRKSKRPSLQERKRSPWDSSLNRPVPKPIKILVCDWAQKYFCAQSESSPFRVTFVTSYSKVFTDKLFDRLFAIFVRLVQESFPRSRSATERRTMKPKKNLQIQHVCKPTWKSINRENQTVDQSKVNSWTPAPGPFSFSQFKISNDLILGTHTRTFFQYAWICNTLTTSNIVNLQPNIFPCNPPKQSITVQYLKILVTSPGLYNLTRGYGGLIHRGVYRWMGFKKLFQNEEKQKLILTYTSPLSCIKRCFPFTDFNFFKQLITTQIKGAILCSPLQLSWSLSHVKRMNYM